MDTLFGALESAAVLVAGLTVRVGLLLIVLVILSVPILLVLTGISGVEAVRRRLHGIMRIGGLFCCDRVFYAPGHTWLRRESRSGVRIGLDDLAQRMFPAPTRLHLPERGATLRTGEPAGAVCTTRRRAAIVSPVDGVVTDVNDAVRQDPTLVHRDPYDRGWLFAVAPSDSAFEALPTGEPGRNWLRVESERLSRFFEMELGVAAADGGDFVLPPPTLLDDAQWATLTREFLGNR
ncbi:MAG: glycine cleavage system protein H [Acidobacteriota bacterium]